jgi:putative OPT family oligopeptide transporter
MPALPLKSSDLMESSVPEIAVAPPPTAERPRELTFRALAYGVVVGAVLSAGNVYSGLKTGFIDGGSIMAALIAFAFFAMIRRLSPASFGERENNIAQTTAASASIMGFAIGLPSSFPALQLMGFSYAPWALSAWGLGLGIIGIFVAAKLREKLVRVDKLPFPTGAATAEVIETLATARQTGMSRAVLLITAAVLAAAFAWFRDGKPAVIPQAWMVDAVIAGSALSALTVGINWSPMMISIGMLMGARAGLSMLLGAVISWIVIAPQLVHTGLVAGANYSALNGWLIWPGVGMLIAGSFVPILADWRAIARSFGDLVGLLARQAPRSAPVDDLPAGKTLLVLSFGVVVVLGVAVFHVGFAVPIIGLLFALVLANVCARSAGETDMAPTGAFGTITQLVLTGNGLSGSVLGGSIVAGAAAQTSQTLWAFKAGERLDGSPRAQLKAQLLGCIVGSVTAVPAYYLITRAYGIATVALPTPSALSWKATAEAVQHGLSAMPPYSPAAGLIGFALGLVLALLLRTRFGRFVPLPTAMGMAIITPFSLSMSMCVGGLIVALARKARPSSEPTVMAIAAGGLAGESVMGVVIAALIASGLLAPG